MTTRADHPTPDAETQPWWDAARQGRLLIRRCGACGRAHLYPRPFCPSCWSDDVEWVRACGRAVLYTYSIVRRNDLAPFADRVPYVVAVVELAEGPRLATNIVDCDEDALVMGMELEVEFRSEAGDFTAPVFRPARATSP